MTEKMLTLLTVTVPPVSEWGERPTGEVFDAIIQAGHDWLWSFLPFFGRGTPAAIMTVTLVFLGAWAVLAWIRGQ